MSEDKKKRSARNRKPAEQVELPLPPPPGPPLPVEPLEIAWWQRPNTVAGLVTVAFACVVLAVAGKIAADRAGDRADAAAAEMQKLTLRAAASERALRISPNPRSWSAAPDATIRWPDPPQLLELYLPVAYSSYTKFAVTVDKVNHGRAMVIERMMPDSNQELRLALNSSAFGPGEYRIRIEGYDGRGQRTDAGWVRLKVD